MWKPRPSEGCSRCCFPHIDACMKTFASLLAIFGILGASPQVHASQPTAEPEVAAAIKAPGVSVVHLWAPWCSNCQAELKSGGWTKMLKDNPQVRFLFVSIWSAGDDGRPLLTKYGIGEQANVMILADPGPRTGAGKLKRFLDLPVTWIPTTWVYKAGDLRYALNYGEVRFPVLQQFIEDTNSEWSHKTDKPAE